MPANAGGQTTEDRRILRIVGIALPVALWLLGVLSPRQGGLTASYLASFTLLLAGLVAVDQTSPRQESPLWQRFAWLLAELALCYFIVQDQGSLVRPVIIYILPASQAVLMFGQRSGLAVSLLTWVPYALNVGTVVWPSRLREFPNYLSFFLAIYVIAVLLTLATVRQAADRRRVQRLYDELQAAHRELITLHQQVREAAVTQERNRLAREIHDSVAHYLTIVNLQLEAAEKLGQEQRERALEQVRRARRLTLECLQEVRRSVSALRASSLEELSLPRALRKLAAEFSESTGIAVIADISLPDDTSVPTQASLALFRVAQEGLTNVHKHAKAQKARLSLSRQNGGFCLSIEDDGTGPGANGKPDQKGFGLLGLRERVDLLGGALSFGPKPTGGSRLSVIVPSENPNASSLT
ncbi:MAG: sensor histidine kinase [Chloroflexi bacterium]|nr:sensor histidine kinase [Chloroflexota bacterium]